MHDDVYSSSKAFNYALAGLEIIVSIEVLGSRHEGRD